MSPLPARSRTHVLGMAVAATDTRGALLHIEAEVASRRKGYLYAANVQGVMETPRNHDVDAIYVLRSLLFLTACPLRGSVAHRVTS